MGKSDREASPGDLQIHAVNVRSFRLDRTEVTVRAYAECVRAGVCGEPESYVDQRGNYRIFCNWKHPEARHFHPINCVDFDQAMAFCAWASKRLPTEEQWEYAAGGRRGGTQYPWGDEAPDRTRLNACGTECPPNLVAKRFPAPAPIHEASDGWPETAPVGSFPAGASKDGALDLAGNVWEWTASRYEDGSDRDTEKKRILRGGSWGGGDPRTEQTTNRFRLPPKSRAQFLGFRCAK